MQNGQCKKYTDIEVGIALQLHEIVGGTTGGGRPRKKLIVVRNRCQKQMKKTPAEALQHPSTKVILKRFPLSKSFFALCRFITIRDRDSSPEGKTFWQCSLSNSAIDSVGLRKSDAIVLLF